MRGSCSWQAGKPSTWASCKSAEKREERTHSTACQKCCCRCNATFSRSGLRQTRNRRRAHLAAEAKHALARQGSVARVLAAARSKDAPRVFVRSMLERERAHNNPSGRSSGHAKGHSIGVGAGQGALTCPGPTPPYSGQCEPHSCTASDPGTACGSPLRPQALSMHTRVICKVSPAEPSSLQPDHAFTQPANGMAASFLISVASRNGQQNWQTHLAGRPKVAL
jgi:hypothetical protein